MKLSIYSLKNILFQGNASLLNCQTIMGEITVLDNHEALISVLSAGVIRIIDGDKKEQFFEIKYNNSILDDGLKNQIEKLLKKELESKIFIDSNLTLKMLAVKCRTNRSYFSQFIHEQYNMNFNTFINMLRINEAKLMLADKNNSLPLKELYLLLGFNTYSVFNEAFKKHVGVTPAFYLKTIQELQEVTNPN